MSTTRFRRGALNAAFERVYQAGLDSAATALEKGAEDTRLKLETVVVTWKSGNKPLFVLIPAKTTATGIRVEIMAQGDEKQLDVFKWVDKGTEAHIILPKKPGGMLAFKGGYSAKTAPIARYGVGTGKASGAKVYSRGVFHPGTEAREFVGYFALEAESLIIDYFRREIREYR